MEDQIYEMVRKFNEEVLSHYDLDLKSYEFFGQENSYILKFKRYGFQNSKFFKPTSSKLVHFTNIHGLSGIIGDGGVRLSGLNTCNDPNELIYFMKLFKNGEIFLDRVSEYSKNVLNLSCCSSEIIGSYEELNQWRLYGDNCSGFAIEMEYIEPKFKQHLSFDFLKVNYLNDEDILKFKDLYEIFIRKNQIGISIDFSSILSSLSMFIKSKHFITERECRIILDCNSLIPENKDTTFKFSKNSNVIQYLFPFERALRIKDEESTDDNSPKLILKNIYVGHRNKGNFENMKRNICFLLEKKDITIDNILLSEMGDYYN